MQKIKSLFIRDKRNPKFVTREVDPDCQWVLDGEGIATIKWDGSACLVRNGLLYRRHQLKEGSSLPEGWLHWDFDPEQKSGHGWVPVGMGPEDAYHREAHQGTLPDGTYELVGPKVQGNPYGLVHHALWKHGAKVVETIPRDFDGLLSKLENVYEEGVVWHHPDGRMAKAKRRDFGLEWPVRSHASPPTRD